MTAPLPQAIHVEALFAGYAGADIIRDISIEAVAGKVTTIAGPNGAGKSTLIKAIVGLLPPRAGRVRIGARDVTKSGPPARAVAGLGYVPQEHNVFKNLTIGENLRVGYEFIRGASSGRAYDDARDRVLDLFPDLKDRLHHIAGTLSGGQRQMLALGCALMPGPSALLLDEPSAGLSPLYVGTMLDAVREVNRSGVTVLMIEQNLVEAMRISDDVVLLVGGEMRGRWDAQVFLHDPYVRGLFLSGSAETAHSAPSRKEVRHGASAA